MSIFRKFIIASLITGMVTTGLLACGGGASNNDQGTSFTAIGYYHDGEGESGMSGLVFQINPDVVDSTSEDAIYPPMALGYLGLQNNLTSQFIRVERFDCSYDIPGADPSLVIPTDTWNISTVIAAAGEETEEGETTEGTSQSFSQFPVVSAGILEFINVNRNSMPDAPFNLIVTCVAVGISQAGDVYESNPASIQAVLHEGYEPFNGSVPTGPGVGGNIGSTSEEGVESAALSALSEAQE